MELKFVEVCSRSSYFEIEYFRNRKRRSGTKNVLSRVSTEASLSIDFHPYYSHLFKELQLLSRLRVKALKILCSLRQDILHWCYLGQALPSLIRYGNEIDLCPKVQVFLLFSLTLTCDVDLTLHDSMFKFHFFFHQHTKNQRFNLQLMVQVRTPYLAATQFVDVHEITYDFFRFSTVPLIAIALSVSSIHHFHQSIYEKSKPSLTGRERSYHAA